MSAERGRRMVLVRHGQTAWNAEKRTQGHADVELDDLGHEQAAAVAPALAALEPTALWSSDLARARQTAAYIAKETGLVPTYDARLREYALGERTGLLEAEWSARFPEAYAAHLDGRVEHVPGGETTAEVATRFGACLSDIRESLGAGETAVVVAHGAALRVGLAVLLGWPIDAASSVVGLSNCGLAVVEELGPGGRMRLVTYGAAR